jgi:hypothetical protein
MHRFIDGEDRMQQTLLPHCLEDYVGEENPVRVIEVFIEELDLAASGFSGMTPAAAPQGEIDRDRVHAMTWAGSLALTPRRINIRRQDVNETKSGPSGPPPIAEAR